MHDTPQWCAAYYTCSTVLSHNSKCSTVCHTTLSQLCCWLWLLFRALCNFSCSILCIHQNKGNAHLVATSMHLATARYCQHVIEPLDDNMISDRSLERVPAKDPVQDSVEYLPDFDPHHLFADRPSVSIGPWSYNRQSHHNIHVYTLIS